VLETTTIGAEQTEALAARLGAACEGGELVVLTGELGSGKTCFVRGLARGLGCDPAAVRSPSFTLLHAYAGRRTLHHFDVYFTSEPVDLRRSGLDEALAAGGVAAVEWGERFAADLPKDRLEIEISHVTPESRRLLISPGGPRAERWLARAALPPGKP
jgi:tRNA threonylcarbamoyladenosine biosynthesis protein TsaE